MKRTIMILVLVLAAITTIGALNAASPQRDAHNGLNTETGNYIYYVYHHVSYRYWGYRTYYYAPRIYVAPVVPVYRVWYRTYFWY